MRCDEETRRKLETTVPAEVVLMVMLMADRRADDDAKADGEYNGAANKVAEQGDYKQGRAVDSVGR